MSKYTYDAGLEREQLAEDFCLLVNGGGVDRATLLREFIPRVVRLAGVVGLTVPEVLNDLEADAIDIAIQLEETGQIIARRAEDRND